MKPTAYQTHNPKPQSDSRNYQPDINLVAGQDLNLRPSHGL